jgi:hypothetical protein
MNRQRNYRFVVCGRGSFLRAAKIMAVIGLDAPSTLRRGQEQTRPFRSGSQGDMQITPCLRKVLRQPIGIQVQTFWSLPSASGGRAVTLARLIIRLTGTQLLSRR